METCFHCGDSCFGHPIVHDEKAFCCKGCKMVFDILNDHDLGHYYDLANSPGKRMSSSIGKYAFLEDKAIADTLLEFDEQHTQVINLYIPVIHCSSCIWVLENLHKLNTGVLSSQVNFPEKTVRITFNKEKLTVYNLVELLCSIGYEPHISLDDSSKKERPNDRSLLYKLGVAGFAFGNIMFLSFPEYFEVGEFWLERFKHLFRWLMFFFSLPVVFYSARGYFISAYKGLRSHFLNIDVPIAIGIAVLFFRSTIEVMMDWGTGFFDSLAGLVFFLLLGKFFQQKTYASLSFERDYKSYFPIAVTCLKKARSKEKKQELQIQVQDLTPGDQILIRNGELIPVDGVLIKGKALIDYSFVTGESEPVAKRAGDLIFAGGKQQSGSIELEVVKSMAQSHLTKLWGNEVFKKDKQELVTSLTDAIGKRFTITILLIALSTSIFWGFYNPDMVLNVFTAVLIVACPCAIALAAPFTLGNLLRIYGRRKLYLKNSAVIETMAGLDTLVFDKTGTLTIAKKDHITYDGVPLSEEEAVLLTSSIRSSNHPLSRSLYAILSDNDIVTLDEYHEEIGSGISAKQDGKQIRIGSLDFVSQPIDTQPSPEEGQNKTAVHIAYENEYKGHFSFTNRFREGLGNTLKKLGKNYRLVVLSGDNDGEQQQLEALLPRHTQYFFNQRPEDKLAFIKDMQQKGRRVMMVGDGLNDAGALAQSDVGIAIAENINVFTPACDGILDADEFKQFPAFLALSKRGVNIIKYAFVFSLLYNLIGLGFAVTGHLKPVVAAILMPLSSISIVVFTTVFTYLLDSRTKIKNV